MELKQNLHTAVISYSTTIFKNKALTYICFYLLRALVFHVHVTLALAKETESNIYGRLNITLFGDGGNSSNLWPRSRYFQNSFVCRLQK